MSGTLLFHDVSCSDRPHALADTPRRIISLSPGITETIFALGLGERLVGVTTHCVFPAQTAAIEKIGEYANPNLERIVALRPDLVVLSREHEKQRLYLERFGIRTLSVDHSTCAALCSSFVRIGQACGAPSAGDSLFALFKSRLSEARPTDRDEPKMLICVGRESPGGGAIKNVFAAGTATFYNELIRAAGGRNAYHDSFPSYPRLSPEGILALAPDIILDIAPAMGFDACSLLVRDWQSMTRIPAVAEKRVYCLSERYATIPGPRLLMLLDDLKRVVSAFHQGRHT